MLVTAIFLGLQCDGCGHKYKGLTISLNSFLSFNLAARLKIGGILEIYFNIACKCALRKKWILLT